MPNLLDPERPRLEGAVEAAADDAARLTLVEAQFGKACGYGQELWRALDVVRHHLVEMLPDVTGDDDARRWLTAPRGPDDDAGWDAWRAVYAGVTSVLAGPHGDSGFGRHEAAREAQQRRGALHAGPVTAELAKQAADAAAQVEVARSGGRVAEPGALDRAPEPSPTSAPPAPGAAGVTSGPLPAVIAAAAAAAGGLAGYLAGTRISR